VLGRKKATGPASSQSVECKGGGQWESQDSPRVGEELGVNLDRCVRKRGKDPVDVTYTHS